MNEKLANKIRQAMNGGKGYDHLSPSSLSIPLAKFFINYLMFTQEERRQQLASYKANYGNACNNPVQRTLCKYIFESGKKLKPKKQSLKENITREFEIIDQIPARDERDAECRKEMKKYIEPTANQIVAAVKEIFGDQELMAERYVHDTPDGLILDILGRIDYESEDKIMELKTKPINFRKTKNGLSAYKQKLPDEPDEAHLKQLAFYWHCTKKTPYLVYANHEEYKIFKPEIPELMYQYDQMINKAFIIQNLLELTEADMNKISQLVEPPDFKSFYYSDITLSQLEEVKKVWRM
jgi:hypothetical protein